MSRGSFSRNRFRRFSPAMLVIAVTAVACAAALVFRAPLRGRYWAWRIAHADDMTQRAAFLSALCRAGDGARWGITALLNDERAEVRQLGLIALQHVRTAWANRQLLEHIGDPDDEVRALAALGLAMRGDDEAVPTLQTLYRSGGPAARAASLALGRLGTPAAVAALNELATIPAKAVERAALVDALSELGTPACVPGLLALLDDHRICPVPAPSFQRAHRIADRLVEDNLLPAGAVELPSIPLDQTIAERAAGALGRITGLVPDFRSALSAEERRRAATTWEQWYDQHQSGP